jgi:hypothetical protein
MFWKAHFFVYAFAVTLLAGVTLIAEGSENHAWEVVASHVLGIVGLIPLYGHAFAKAIGLRAIWVLLIVAMLVVDVVIPLTEILPYLGRLSWDHSRWTLIAGEFLVVLLTIYFLAVIRYIFFRPQLWKKDSAKTSAI